MGSALRATRTTLRDIAEASGVDVSTVSRSLNGSYGIHRETREKVLAVAAQLNYRSAKAPRSTVTTKSRTIGLIVSDIANPYFAEVARGAEEAAASAGCEVVLCNSDFNSDKQIRYIQSLLEKRVEGILMNSIGVLDRPQQEQLAASGVPVVLLNRPRSISNFSTVTADNNEGGFLAGEHLLRLGHTQIAHLSGPRDHGNLRERARGFLRAVTAHPGASPVFLHGEHTFRGGYDLGRMLLAKHPNVTAVFAANDVVAFGAVRAFIEAGLELPRDMSIVGFDNLELSCITNPPLTTIHQPKSEIGRAAVEIIAAFSKTKDPHLPEHRMLGVKLIERQSCAAPRDGNLRT